MRRWSNSKRVVIMARNDREMDDKCITIPQDLASLKRPALQKLCKRLGLKANGKNVEMVGLLEQFRDRNLTEEQVSGGKSENESHNDSEKSREVTGEEGENCEMSDNVTPLNSSPVEPENKEKPKTPESDVETEKEREGERTTSLSSEAAGGEDETERMEIPTTPERARERRFTYSVSPEPARHLSPLHTPGDMVATPTSGSRKRRRTHSVSPASSLLLSGCLSVEGVPMTTETAPATSPDEKGSNSESATAEMMALLNQRVADRKADPSYVAPSLSTSALIQEHKLAGSLIPVSTTVDKLNRAHEREFSKMRSILEYSERKKKRVLISQNTATPAPPAKKQKVAPKTPKTPYEPQMKTTKSHVKPSTTVGRKSGVLSAMKPCPQPDFNFSKCDSGPTSDAPAPTTNTGSLSESAPVQFTFTAKSGGKTAVRRHKGKLPDFKFSIY